MAEIWRVDTFEAVRDRPDLQGVAIDHAHICLKHWCDQHDEDKCQDATHFSCGATGMDFGTTSSYNVLMARMQPISLRRRGFIGALIGAAIPYGLAAYNNGLLLGGQGDLWFFVAFLAAFLAVLGACVASDNFGHRDSYNEQFDINEQDSDWRDYDRENADRMLQVGRHSSLRDAWDRNYQLNSWD